MLFFVLSILSTLLILLANAKVDGSNVCGGLAVIVVIAQIVAAFLEFGFLGGLTALVIATIVEGLAVGITSGKASSA